MQKHMYMFNWSNKRYIHTMTLCLINICKVVEKMMKSFVDEDLRTKNFHVTTPNNPEWDQARHQKT